MPDAGSGWGDVQRAYPFFSPKFVRDGLEDVGSGLVAAEGRLDDVEQDVVDLQNAPSGPFGLVGIVTFASSGSFVKADYSGLRAVRVRLVAGGGGGGGVTSSATGRIGAAGGGGGGGYAERFLLASALSASETVTVGAAGSASSGGAGGSGGSSSFGSTLVVAAGGAGAAGFTANVFNGVRVSAGGSGGAGSTGDVTVAGGVGGYGSLLRWQTPNTGQTEMGIAMSGVGGSSVFGEGGVQRTVGAFLDGSNWAGHSTAGDTGTLYGAGGSGGAIWHENISVAGGAGRAGVVVVELYA